MPRSKGGTADNETPEETRAARRRRVIEMYQAKHRLVDITTETGTPRATIYLWLDEEGIAPNRNSRASGEVLTLAEVLDRLRQVERENGVLRHELEKAQALAASLLDRALGKE
jgi:hypothetical protein